ATEIKDGRRSRIAGCPGTGQQGQVEYGEIALSDEDLAAVRHRLPVYERQQTAQSISSARRHDDGMLLFQGACDRRQTLLVSAGKALMHSQRSAVHGSAKTQLTQAHPCQ